MIPKNRKSIETKRNIFIKTEKNFLLDTMVVEKYQKGIGIKI